MPMLPEPQRPVFHLVANNPTEQQVSVDLADCTPADQIALLLAMQGSHIGGVALKTGDRRCAMQWFSKVSDLRKAAELPFQSHQVPVNTGLDQMLGGVDIVESLLQSKTIERKGLLARADRALLLLPFATLQSPDVIRSICQSLDTGVVNNDKARVCVVALTDNSRDADDAEPIDAALLDRLAFSLTLDESAVISETALDGDERLFHPDAAGFDSQCRDLQSSDLQSQDLQSHDLPHHDLEHLGQVLRRAIKTFADVIITDKQLHRICSIAEVLGIESLRAQVHCARVARAVAALAARQETIDADTDLAMSLCFMWRATQLPAQPESGDQASDTEQGESQQNAPQPNESQQDEKQTDSDDSEEVQDSTQSPELSSDHDDATSESPAKDSNDADSTPIDTAKAMLPEDLLKALAESLANRNQRIYKVGRSGRPVTSACRGRMIGTQRYRPGTGQKINLTATLREAAPWQQVRRTQIQQRQQHHQHGQTELAADNRQLIIHPQDIRASRFKQSTQTVTVFAVDASGSAAARRLSEAKGAVELLLAECYVRRDQVALIVFQGASARLVLPPTRSLVRARRELTQLPAGGGTPLAAAIDLAKELGTDIARAGNTPLLCLLTDGRANVDRDGVGGRAQASQQALDSALQLAESGMQSLVIDIAARPASFANQLASAMRGQYLALPRADAKHISSAVNAAMVQGPSRAGAA